MKLAIRLPYIIASFCLLAYVYYQHQYDNIYVIDNDFCRQNTLIQLAKEQGLGFKIVQDFDVPAIQVSGKTKIIQHINKRFEEIYPNTQVFYPYQQCYLTNVKYNVPHINKKLLPYIPDNVHYVSYAPKADKAVYCYYFSSTYSGSQCYFLHIKQQYGSTWLEQHDISDMERNNIGWGLQNYTLEKGKTINDLHNVYSYVDSWLDNPNETIFPYGFLFMTSGNGYRWYGGERY